MTEAYIGLGSNLEHPAQQVRLALTALASLPDSQLVCASSLYRTTPVGYAAQPDFINAVAKIETQLSPHQLLAHLMQIEARFGRVRSFRNAPRVLDLDLLYYVGSSLKSEQLTLPHPRMQERSFVMIPLAEIAADLILEGLGKVGSLAKQLSAAGVERQQESTA